MGDSFRKVEIIFTGVVALFTVVLAVVSVFQWRVTKLAADAAKDSADAAVKQADIADRTMRVTLRPYVAVGRSKGSLAEWIVAPSGKYEGIRVYFQNAGATPAKRFYVNGAVLPSNFASFHHLEMKPEAITQNGFSGLSYTSGLVLAAHETMAFQIPNTGEKEIALGLANKKGPFVLSGSLEYVNVFDEYCCESFRIIFENGAFRSTVGPPRKMVCPNLPNVCTIPRELEFPP